MGRYNQGQPTDLPSETQLGGVPRPLCSSKNQRLELLTDRYTLADFQPQTVEINIHQGGLVQLTGFPVGVNPDNLLS